jgi:hypothetical protein
MFSGTAAGWVAIGALIVAAAAVLVGLVAWLTLRRIRRAQTAVLGTGREDLVDFAVTLQTRIDELRSAVDEVAAALVRVDKRVDGTLRHTALVRYDAYEDVGGQQSASLAFLDATRSGIVMTAIQGRDYARIYVKELDRGRAPVSLSPEEREAVERAMQGARSRAAQRSAGAGREGSPGAGGPGYVPGSRVRRPPGLA